MPQYIKLENQEELYSNANSARDKCIQDILDSEADKKVIVAGPGTGKTYLFKKVLEGKKKSLTLTFVNSLVEDLALELYGLSEVRTLHSFGRKILSKILKKEINIYSKLSKIIEEEYLILNGVEIDYGRIFHEREDDNENIPFYEARRHYYEYYGFADVIFAAIKRLEANHKEIPKYDQVLIDEFQDFNKLEVSLIDLLAEYSPILLAGDDDQALYEFIKHASARHIRERHGDGKPEYAAFNLPYCARCPKVVVDATNDLINTAKEHGLLNERINKPYLYFPTKEKDKLSQQYPSIGHINCYAAQVPWFIEKTIKKIAEEIRGKFEVLIITPTKTQVRTIAKGLKEKGFNNIHYPEGISEREADFYDGFNMLLTDKNDNLGWRIISSVMLETQKFTEIIKKSIEKPDKQFKKYLPDDFVKSISTTLQSLKKLLKEEGVEPEILSTIFEQFEIEPTKLSTEYLITRIKALNPQGGSAALRNMPIKITTVQSSKGLSADIVFIVNFDDRYFLKDKGKVTDHEICNFLVALTRTKKKAFLISTVQETPLMLKWISSERIEKMRMYKKEDEDEDPEI